MDVRDLGLRRMRAARRARPAILPRPGDGHGEQAQAASRVSLGRHSQDVREGVRTSLISGPTSPAPRGWPRHPSAAARSRAPRRSRRAPGRPRPAASARPRARRGVRATRVPRCRRRAAREVAGPLSRALSRRVVLVPAMPSPPRRRAATLSRAHRDRQRRASSLRSRSSSAIVWPPGGHHPGHVACGCLGGVPPSGCDRVDGEGRRLRATSQARARQGQARSGGHAPLSLGRPPAAIQFFFGGGRPEGLHRRRSAIAATIASAVGMSRGAASRSRGRRPAGGDDDRDAAVKPVVTGRG